MSKDDEIKTNLADLVSKIEVVVTEHIKDMSKEDIKYVLEHYSRFLTLDLIRNFKAAKKTASIPIPFEKLFDN